MKLIILALYCVFLGGCSIALLTHPVKTSEVKDVIRMKSPRVEFINVVEKIGKENGYIVRKAAYQTGILDTSIGQPMSITLTSDYGPADAYVSGIIGTVRIEKLNLDSKDSGKTWDCHIWVEGNFSSGKEDAALNFWSEFKPKLLQRLEQEFAADIVTPVPGTVSESPVEKSAVKQGNNRKKRQKRDILLDY